MPSWVCDIGHSLLKASTPPERYSANTGMHCLRIFGQEFVIMEMSETLAKLAAGTDLDSDEMTAMMQRL